MSPGLRRHRRLERPPTSVFRPAPGIGTALLRVGLVIGLLYGGIAVGLGWWQVAEAGRLTEDPLNPLRLAAMREEPRGRILDARGRVLAMSIGEPGSGQRRRYPAPVVAPIVGYQSLLLGTAGLERTYDPQLVGIGDLGPGGDLLRKLRPDPVDPSDLQLSIDLRLQRLAASLLGDDKGAVVALEPATGRVLALVSSPTYDPNRLSSLTTGRDYLEALRADPDAPLLDRATQGRYVPGSVFKIVTAVAGLESGAIRSSTRFSGQPRQSVAGFVVDGYRIGDAERDVQLDAPLDLAEAMEVSSNVWFAHAALEIGPEALRATTRDLGFERPIGFELPTVTSQVNAGDGPLDGFDTRVELASAGFGQGDVLVTPLQMALVTAAIANGGEMIAPRLVDRVTSANGEVRDLGSRGLGRVMSGETAETVREAMTRAVEGRFAEGIAGGAKVPGIRTAGKSGSAQLDGAAPHSWFVGFAPADDPRIVVVVVVENAGAGADRAVPMGGRLMEAWLRRFAPD
jgi:peptidoglycan glycosyltransferase